MGVRRDGLGPGGTDRNHIGAEKRRWGWGALRWYMIMCKYSLKLQEKRYKMLEPSELDTESALASAGIPSPSPAASRPPQNQERFHWICQRCPGHMQGGSGRLSPVGWGCPLHPAPQRGAAGTATRDQHRDRPWSPAAPPLALGNSSFPQWYWGAGGSGRGRDPRPHQPPSWQIDSVWKLCAPSAERGHKQPAGRAPGQAGGPAGHKGRQGVWWGIRAIGGFWQEPGEAPSRDAAGGSTALWDPAGDGGLQQGRGRSTAPPDTRWKLLGSHWDTCTWGDGT